MIILNPSEIEISAETGSPFCPEGTQSDGLDISEENSFSELVSEFDLNFQQTAAGDSSKRDN